MGKRKMVSVLLMENIVYNVTARRITDFMRKVRWKPKNLRILSMSVVTFDKS